MSDKGKEVNSLGKGESAFCGTLRAAIRSEFGSSKAFAGHVGISESRTSQLLSGAEITTAPTLEYLLSAFSSVATQSRIQESWIRSYAPDPVARIDQKDLPGFALRFMTSIPELLAKGRPRATLTTLEALLGAIKDQGLWFSLARKAIEIALVLDMPNKARTWSDELLLRAKAFQDLPWIAYGLYLRMTVERSSFTGRPAEMVRRFSDFEGYILNWTPSNSDSRVIKDDLKGACIRDRALLFLELSERNRKESLPLKEAARCLDAITVRDMHPVGKPIHLEVSGRLWLALDDKMLAEDRFEESQLFEAHMSPTQALKSEILRCKLLKSGFDEESANLALYEALQRAYDLEDLHHARVIEFMLA